MLMTDPERISTTEVRLERLLFVVKRFALVRSRAHERPIILNSFVAIRPERVLTVPERAS